MARGAGIYGPYRSRNGWILHLRPTPGRPGGTRRYSTEGEALADAEKLRSDLRTEQSRHKTVDDAIDAYGEHLEARHYKHSVETLRRIRVFFAADLDAELARLTPRRCVAAWEALQRRTTPKGEQLSVTSARGYLTHTRTFLRWCVSQRWLAADPTAGIQPREPLAHGKEQLRIDEARRWAAKALELAPKHPGAVAALCALLLGLRASEITTRQVRDLDDEGRLLWVPRSKTKAGRRTLETGDLLRPLLEALARGRPGDALLFGGRRRNRRAPDETVPHLRGWVLHWTKRICDLAEVPRVSAHGLRGTHASLAVSAHATVRVVSEALGHATTGVTLQSYADADEVARAKQRQALEVLRGGKR